MSILENNDSGGEELSLAKITAQDIVKQTRKTFNQIVKMFNSGSETFWANPNKLKPSEIAVELGSDAKEVFQLHYLLGQLIQMVKPESIEKGINLIGTFTLNEDGTITTIDIPSTTLPPE
jgi:hypothetical protein